MMPQLRLWAKMIQCGTHDDHKEPPNVPMITGMSQKRTKRGFLAETFAGAAEAIAKAFSPAPATHSVRHDVGAVGISPGKCTDLREKKFTAVASFARTL